MIPIREYLTIDLPVLIRSSSPAAVRYMRPPTTTMIIPMIPITERRKFKMPVRISVMLLALSAGVPFTFPQPKMAPISLRKEGAAKARARPMREAVMMSFPVESLESFPPAVIYTIEPMTIMIRERITMMAWRKPQIEVRSSSTVLKAKGLLMGIV